MPPDPFPEATLAPQESDTCTCGTRTGIHPAPYCIVNFQILQQFSAASQPLCKRTSEPPQPLNDPPLRGAFRLAASRQQVPEVVIGQFQEGLESLQLVCGDRPEIRAIEEPAEDQIQLE